MQLTNMCVYIYIYVHISTSISISLSLYIYIYIHVYIYIYICIHMYTYISQAAGSREDIRKMARHQRHINGVVSSNNKYKNTNNNSGINI